MILKTVSISGGRNKMRAEQLGVLQMLQLPSHSFQERKYGKKYKHTIHLEWLGNELYIEPALSYLSYD